MQTYEKRTRNLWRGWRQEASEALNISARTVDDWFNNSEPKLFTWLEKEIAKRLLAKEKAEEIKKNIISPVLPNNECCNSNTLHNAGEIN